MPPSSTSKGTSGDNSSSSSHDAVRSGLTNAPRDEMKVDGEPL